jgi:hypothetical protein
LNSREKLGKTVKDGIGFDDAGEGRERATAFYAFTPVALLPIGARLIWANDTIHIALGIMTVTYAAALSFFARPINTATRR